MQQFCQWQFVNRKEMAKPHIHFFLSHSRSISAPMPLIANVFVNVFFNVFLSVFVNVFVNVFGKALFPPFFPTVGQYQRQCHQLPMSVSMSSLISRQATNALSGNTAQFAKCICSNFKMYLSKFLNVFVSHGQCQCQCHH